MTRDDLLRASAELIAEQGLAALSLRKIADRVGIKAPSIYVHFASKEALLAEASQHASAALCEVLKQEGRGRDAYARLLATALGYLRFAADQPSLFALLFRELPSVRRSLDERPGTGSPYGLLLERVRDFLGGGPDGDPHRVEILGFGIWSMVHGAAVLRQTHLRDFSGPIVDGTRQNLERLLAGWRTDGPAARGPTRTRP